MSRVFPIIGKTLLYGFAAIGFLFVAVFLGMRAELFNVRGSIDERNDFFLSNTKAADAVQKIAVDPCLSGTTTVCLWSATPEWAVVAAGLEKDKAVILRVEGETGVSARQIAAIVVPEQIRFFTAEREVFKRYFEPLKILGSLSQFSLGVTGIKEATARDIERHALDTTSPFYPGTFARTLIAYPDDADRDAILYARLTDPKDHYYSYLYTALAIKEVQMQWKRSGYDITEQPGIVATLFNIGFLRSKPHEKPEIGGAPIETGGQVYTFGGLAQEFYDSTELSDVFPRIPQ